MTAPDLPNEVPANLTNPEGDPTKREVVATETALLDLQNDLLEALKEEAAYQAASRGDWFYATKRRTVTRLAFGEAAAINVSSEMYEGVYTRDLQTGEIFTDTRPAAKALAFADAASKFAAAVAGYENVISVTSLPGVLEAFGTIFTPEGGILTVTSTWRVRLGGSVIYGTNRAFLQVDHEGNWTRRKI